MRGAIRQLVARQLPAPSRSLSSPPDDGADDNVDMTWEHTLRQWVSARSSEAENVCVDSGDEQRAPVVRTASLCVASGKGGTGKSIVCASLAELLSARGRTLVVDADMGVGNAHILHDVHPPRSFVDVVSGRSTVADARVRCAARLDLVGGGSGVSHMASLSSCELHLIASGLAEIEHEYEFVLVDSAAGISDQTLFFASACDAVLIVTTPDTTAMTDAYAFIKVLHARRPDVLPLLAVNRVALDGAGADELSAERVFQRLDHVCTRFLGFAPKAIGAVPDDRAVLRSVAARRPVVRDAPGSNAALALRSIAARVQEELSRRAGRGLSRTLSEQLEFFRPDG